MFTVVLSVHILVCVLMVIFVLLQAGKGAGLSVFGGGGGDTIFASPTGSSFMRKFTASLAIIFGITSLLLTLLSSRVSQRSVTSRFPAPPPPQEAPAQPGTAPLVEPPKPKPASAKPRAAPATKSAPAASPAKGKSK
ncbi:MAG: preprotein translocase subunit SecG [Elusimicrobia bacterium]|nr:preprotein translocase subunit SecG [Elusimicrobiota bacterium]